MLQFLIILPSKIFQHGFCLFKFLLRYLQKKFLKLPATFRNTIQEQVEHFTTK